MNLRFTILLGYIVLFLWLWMMPNTRSEAVGAVHYAPMWGFMLSAWILVRLERMSRQARELKAKQAETASGEHSEDKVEKQEKLT